MYELLKNSRSNIGVSDPKSENSNSKSENYENCRHSPCKVIQCISNSFPKDILSSIHNNETEL